MGVDITLFLEFWDDSDGSPPWGIPQDPRVIAWSHRRVHSLSTGEFEVGRSYRLFGALAGVRSNLTPLFAPRGLPSIVSMAVAEVIRMPIYADDVPSEEVFADGGVHHSTALKMIAEGSRYVGPPTGGQNYDFVSEPLDSASWLFMDEVDAAMSHHGVRDFDGDHLFAAVISAMRTLEVHWGARKTRLVFWFS